MNDTVYVTFPTTKRTANLLTELAHIQGMTQPALLNNICQAYLHEAAFEMIEYMKDKGIDPNKAITTLEQEIKERER